MNEDKKAYLSIIQEPIGRMSTASSVFKGFSATIVTGTAALSNSGIKTALIILIIIPVLAFAALDIYYLRTERLYRRLYNDVIEGIHPIDYSMTIPNDKAFEKRAFASIIDCMKSPSIWLFYPAMLVVLILICVLS